ncbi:MAG: S8/S53 family peptidase [Candidatus Gracilibacteria bacterium]|nr:S8/S53 family peptidase [Candidatus Gracilibacteria bacterium]
MKKTLLATLLFSSYSLAESNEDPDRYTFEAGKNEYMHVISFDSDKTTDTILEDYPEYYRNSGVMIGIFDAGFYFDHEDLKGVLSKGTNKKHYHGTLVAGIISAKKDNELGYTGMVQGKGIYGMRYQDKTNITERETYLKNLCSHFDVINISQTLAYSSYRYKKSSYDEVKHLRTMQWWREIFSSTECSDTLFIVTAGNSNVDSKKENGGIHYSKNSSGNYVYNPSDNIIVAGAIQDDEITRNYGQSVDIYAPENVGGPYKVTSSGTSTYTTNRTGTSYAAPQVTAVAAMIQYEIDNNPARLKEYMLEKADLTMINKVKGKSTRTTSRPILNVHKIVEKVVNDFGPKI